MSENKNQFESYRDIILSEYEKGNVVFLSMGNLMVAEINNFVSQPVDGILYDLNRGEEVVLQYIEEQKWVNDYAVAKTIRKLKEQNEEMIEILKIIFKDDYYESFQEYTRESKEEMLIKIIEKVTGKTIEEILK